LKLIERPTKRRLRLNTGKGKEKEEECVCVCVRERERERERACVFMPTKFGLILSLNKERKERLLVQGQDAKNE
ncbi:hypothetical protein ACMBCM_09330, partial [Spiroplasma sp. K1]